MEILFALAKALNAADKLHPVLTHDAVYTNMGYVLPVGRKHKWQVRIPTQRDLVMTDRNDYAMLRFTGLRLAKLR